MNILKLGNSILDRLPFTKKPSVRQFIWYVFFAGIATLVDVGFLIFFTEIVGLLYLYSAAISYTMGMITNYLTNKKWNFQNKSKKYVQQFSLFVFVALVGLGLNQLFIWVGVELLGLWYVFAKIIALFIVVIWSFIGHKHITFHKVK